jgi:uncharacterized protein YndB with AHSA1/START domain
MPADRELVISRLIAAPRRLVFKAWTEPQHVARWWGPLGFTTIYCDMDIRVGGAYRFGMRSPEGREHWKRGVYREIVEPERIVFTFAWEDANGNPGHELLTTVTFAAEGRNTRLTLRQGRFEKAAGRDDHLAGWTSCLQRFADFVLSLTPGERHDAGRDDAA